MDTGASLLGMNTFAIDKWLVDACGAMGIHRPTPIQVACVPAALEGKDVIGCAQTGSGKTLAFALPILQRLSEDPYGVFALVVTPTRELAMQIVDQFRVVGSHMRVKVATVIGGVDPVKQGLELAQRPHVIVATPGRLVDFMIGSTPPYLKRLRFLVLDEADRLLDGGFGSDLGVILAALPSKRQTLVFSATMTKNLEELQSMSFENECFHFDANPEQELAIVETVEQQYVFIPAKVKECYLVEILETLEPKSTIIFTATCEACQFVHELLAELEIDSAPLHSVLAQGKRMASLARFKSGLVNVLVATDVAARGLDIPQVDLVLNFDIPREPASYVHRVGRTARAGREGRALSLVTQYDIKLVLAIEEATGSKLVEHKVEEEAVLRRMSRVSKAMRSAKLTLIDGEFKERQAKRKLKRGRNEDEGAFRARRKAGKKQLAKQQRGDARERKSLKKAAKA